MKQVITIQTRMSLIDVMAEPILTKELHLKGIELFVHKSTSDFFAAIRKEWTVTEGTSGMKVADHKLKSVAIERAIEALMKQSRDHIDHMIATGVKTKERQNERR